MLHRFRPEVIEERLCNVNLTDLNHAHGDNPHEDETGHVRIQTEEVRQKPYGKEANHRPEEDLEEAEDIPPRHDPVLNHEGPYLNQFPLQIR